jgi:hypothetical protein
MEHISAPLLGEPKRVALQPHLAPHGHHMIEWTYHFPIENIDLIHAELEILIPSEKSSALARDLLLKGIISHTRFSLAVETASVQELTSLFYNDSRAIRMEFDFPALADDHKKSRR